MSSTTFNPSPHQVAIFDFVEHGQGSAIVEAVAGSGKTTTIVRALPKMRGHIFLGAFNKKMAEELKRRTEHLEGVEASTFHSAGFRAYGRAIPGRKFVTKWKLGNITKAMQELPEYEDLHAGMFRAAEQCVSMAKQRAFGTPYGPALDDRAAWDAMVLHFELDAFIADDDYSTWLALCVELLERSNLDAEENGQIDFDDMIYLPLLHDIDTVQYDWVLIDEAQDTNPARRALAKKLLRPGGRLIAVGDPRQAIYGFTGADNDSMDQIAAEHKAIRLPLTVSYRCPRRIVQHARQWVKHIEAHSEAPEGSVQSIDGLQLLAMADAGDAILCRLNAPLVKMCLRFIREGRRAKIEGRDIGENLLRIVRRWKFRYLRELSDRLETYREEEIASAIKKKRLHRVDTINDQCDTLAVLIDRTQDLGGHTLKDLERVVDSLFSDTVDAQAIQLVSVHRSKGMEWRRVFILGRESLMPSRSAKLPWQVVQELNLIYVAVTRAMDELYEVEQFNLKPAAAPKAQTAQAFPV